MKRFTMVVVALLFSFSGASMLFAYVDDPTPDPFTFTDRTDVALSTEFKSNTITVSGIDAPAAISVVGGTYSVNGAAFTSASGAVTVGNTVKVRKMSAATYSTTKSATLTIGGVSDTFSVTTMAEPPDTTPDAFHFTDRTGVALSTEYKSNAIKVAGINMASPISIVGGTYAINGGAYTSASGTVTVGNTVKVRKMSAAAYSTTKSATLTIGGVSDTFSVTTIASVTGKYIADYTVAKDSVLRSIPDTYINTARTTLHVAYNHTSHGTHVSYGVYGLPGFKTGDATKFGVTNAADDPAKLDFHDNEIGGAYGDLSTADANWATWRDQVRAYLDDADNANINVMMWSWCDITGHSVPTYLSSMQTLINEYGAGGSKIGTGPGKTRTTPVTFIFMTGHANGDANTGAGMPRDQAKLITDYCTAHGYYCIDYYSIDTHAMNDTYYEDASDDAVSAIYGGGNFYLDWQTAHTLGTDWYANRTSPGGSVSYGQHNTQHITANRKAFAFWWVLARIAGMD